MSPARLFLFVSRDIWFLVLAYNQARHASLDVGFYYMANAGGRLMGTLLSGLTYQWGGLVLCLSVSAVFLMAAWVLSLPLPDNSKGQGGNTP